jgi:nitrite reductase/ring-hydroxylating ferredoxin subunit/Fe-S cluster biogenesis protein NfuA
MTPLTAAADIETWVRPILALEGRIAGWDAEHALTVQALKSAIEDLHKEALTRLIRALKDDPAAAVPLREALSDPVIYGVLRHHGLVKVPLNERVLQALEDVRPALAAHGGGVELVAVEAPDTVHVRLIGSCHGCPASAQTLGEGIEAAIRARCPEIVHVKQVSRGGGEQGGARGGGESTHTVSPFALQRQLGWLDAGCVADIPEGGMTVRTLEGYAVLLAKHGAQVSCFDNACAHLGMPLDMAEVSDGVIICSYHGFRYRLATGECLTAPGMRLKAHAVRVANDRVQVRLGR